MADPRDEQFEKLWGYYGRVVLFLKSFGFPMEDVRELAQTVYVRVYERMGEYRHEAYWSYLEKVARNVALNAIRDRHAAKRDAILEPEEKLLGVGDRGPTPEEALEKKLAAQLLRDAVDRLDYNLRISVLLYLADFSYQEICQILGISQAALKSRLNAARAKLRELLGQESEGLGESDDS